MEAGAVVTDCTKEMLSLRRRRRREGGGEGRKEGRKRRETGGRAADGIAATTDCGWVSFEARGQRSERASGRASERTDG